VAAFCCWLGNLSWDLVSWKLIFFTFFKRFHFGSLLPHLKGLFSARPRVSKQQKTPFSLAFLLLECGSPLLSHSSLFEGTLHYPLDSFEELMSSSHEFCLDFLLQVFSGRLYPEATWTIPFYMIFYERKPSSFIFIPEGWTDFWVTLSQICCSLIFFYDRLPICARKSSFLWATADANWMYRVLPYPAIQIT